MRWAIVAARHYSLRQAANTLNVRQSTLSRRLRELECRLGAALFERSSSGTRPTLAGQEFLEAAQRIIADVDSACHRLKARTEGKSGRLTIGVSTSFSTGNLRATLIEYQRRYPEVDVRAADGPRDRLLGDLAINALDILIAPGGSSGWEDRSQPLWSERVIVAVPDGHPLAERGTIHWLELADERLLLPQNGPGPELERLLAAKLGSSSALSILHQAAGLDRLLSLVGAGYGSLLMLEGGTGLRYDGVVYREVHDDDGPTRLNFKAYWRRRNDSPTLGPFLDMLRERYPDLSVEPDPG
jgi:DNA-binding transcriptional LysR family regulator